ncbi:MAG: hypothetical protein FWG63_12740, partial [Defluviitaleaceae bacterium]|nr:hypothetical protein [Defluviitaleaceae bacterium]
MKHLVLTIFFLLFNTAVTRADTTESYLVYNIYDEDSQCQTLFSSQESTYEQRPANIDVSPISFVFAEREFGYEPFTAQHFSSMGPVRFSILNNNPVPVYEVRVSVSSPTFEIHRGLSAQTANWPGSHPNNPEGDGITELPSAIYPPSQRSRNVQVRPIVGLLPGEHNAYLEIRGVVDGENVAVNVPISFTVTGEAPFIPDPEPEPEEP